MKRSVYHFPLLPPPPKPHHQKPPPPPELPPHQPHPLLPHQFEIFPVENREAKSQIKKLKIIAMTHKRKYEMGRVTI